MTPEKKVLSYLKDQDTTPLHFSGRAKVNNTGQTLKDLVISITKATVTYCSLDSDNNGAEGSDRMRSIEDIWRHVKSLRPDTSIFEVMRAVFSITEDGFLYSWVCHDIERRVFHYQHSEDYDNYGKENIDEFGLRFKAWEHIGETL